MVNTFIIYYNKFQNVLNIDIKSKNHEIKNRKIFLEFMYFYIFNLVS
jgi:hypothetical protein